LENFTNYSRAPQKDHHPLGGQASKINDLMLQIQENEVLLRDGNQWLYFSEPQKIVTASARHEVLPALLEIERLVEQENWYAAGFISYEAASAFDSALVAQPLTDFPYLWFGLYPEPSSVNLPAPQSSREVLEWQPTIDRETYDAAIVNIKENISQGKTYQVNYTMRLRAEYRSDPWNFFLHLVQNQNKYAAYIDTGRYVICSASPELFFQLDGDMITCRPMKGTVKRGHTTAEDRTRSEWLKTSEKNRAENVMIVDMIRNDLGQLAKTGTVRVPELFCTERYSTLWQMTSTITGETVASLTGILRALFPSASITGAPKVSTMRIINKLEPTPRKIYTGAIGYCAPNRKAKFSVAIRTALLDRDLQKVEYGVGGGIVWDSNSSDEYAEAVLKARVLTESPPEFSLFETMLWTPEQNFFLLEKHIDRLLDSANYFDFPTSRTAIEEYLGQLTCRFRVPQRVRLLLDKTGKIDSESTTFQSSKKFIQIKLAKQPIDSRDVFLYHKTTRRDVYENARADLPNVDDVLLYNEQNELTEFTIGNLVVQLDGQFVTPPVKCGLLAGTFRAHLLETGQVVERVVTVPELMACTKILRVNSIRQWEPVQMEQ
jgi:para-aminobenzoate synthetase/4-amino-4-deoxychorismate lyase